jgi:hypothetical protein
MKSHSARARFFSIAISALALALWHAQAAETPANTLTAAERAAGWKLLFDGTSLQGWRLYGQPGPPGSGWQVQHGVLKKLAKVRGGDIITETKFGDFDLSWEWRLEPGANNGLKYLVTEQRTAGPGPEYQMVDDVGHPDGRRGPKRQTGSFYDVLPAPTTKPLKPVGEWNQSRVFLQGQHVEHWLNGVKLFDYELGSAALKEAVAASKFKNAPGFGDKIQGHIMLTDHQDECWFRNIKIRELTGEKPKR